MFYVLTKGKGVLPSINSNSKVSVKRKCKIVNTPQSYQSQFGSSGSGQIVHIRKARMGLGMVVLGIELGLDWVWRSRKVGLE